MGDGASFSVRSWLIVPLIVGLSAGCASRVGPRGPVVSPTGIVYELGTPPVETRFSQTAVLYLRQENVERALELALEGIESDPENPIHYYLAGVAYARMGDGEAARPLLEKAQQIYPAYELDVEPERERAWAVAFNEGIESFDAGDVEGAIEAWTEAADIYDLRPEAHRNLAALLAGEGRYEEAIDAYRGALGGLERRPATRVLPDDEVAARDELRVTMEENLAQILLFSGRFQEAEPLLRARLERSPDDLDRQRDLARALTGLGRHGEATEIYAALLSSRTLESTELFNVGVALFRSGDFAEARRAFLSLTELQPNSRDAWFNYANTLFAAEDWSSLVSATSRLLELDPLSEDAGLIAARAHLELGDEEAARSGLERTEGAPVFVEALRMMPQGRATRIEGNVVGNAAEPGSVVRLRFTFYGDQRVLGMETVVAEAPIQGESDAFEVSVQARASGYRYELLP